MDFNDTPEEAMFRAEARAWLAANARAYATPPKTPWSETELVRLGRAWLARKAAGGFSGILWPKELGGRGGTVMEALIFDEEERRYHVPQGIFTHIGQAMAIPTIRKHGTPAQIKKFAGPTLRGEMIWCQLFSEPGGGSDLAGVRTRAVRQGDHYVVNGQKVWSSWAHHADWGILLARTDPSVVKHKGLSFFVLDMKTPGVEVRPIRQISGASDFNETYLSDVRIPADGLIGQEGEGWACAMTVLTSERLGAGGRDGSGIGDLIALAARTADGEGVALDSCAVREKLAFWYAQEQAQKHFHARLVTKLSRGENPGAEAALVKLVYANRLQHAAGFGMEMQALAGLAHDGADPAQNTLWADYIWSTAMRIAGGADEVLLNQLAERVLGLPGDIRADKDVPFDQL